MSEHAAWIEGARAAWLASGEGWNGEYTGLPGTPDAIEVLATSGVNNPYPDLASDE